VDEQQAKKKLRTDAAEGSSAEPRALPLAMVNEHEGSPEALLNEGWHPVAAHLDDIADTSPLRCSSSDSMHTALSDAELD
jgi:hypothetical protein